MLAGSTGKRCPVAQTELLQALEQAAIDQDPAVAIFDEVFGSGDRAGPA